MIHVVINPAAGGRISERLFTEEIEPRLKAKSRRFDVHRTESPGDGARIASLIRSSMGKEAEELEVILVGGDGTTHEFINGLMGQPGSQGRYTSPPRTSIALVPAGTANALYASLYPPDQGGASAEEEGDAWRLKSLEKMLDTEGSGSLYPLALASVSTTAGDSGSGDEEKTTLAHLITSHALHASILADSEALRATHPGIERFKMAAEQNTVVWTQATLKLRPLDTQSNAVFRYDPFTKAFVKEDASTLDGPFVYVACLSTDRLEPHFVPGPFSGPARSCPEPRLARPEDALDLLLIRPCRDPTVVQSLKRSIDEIQDWSGDDTADVRIQFAQKRLGPIMFKGVYSGGKHVAFTYPAQPDGEMDEASEGKENQVIACEYIRCGGYEWTPAQADAKAKRTCIDGTVLEGQQKTEVRVVTKEEGAGCILAYL